LPGLPAQHHRVPAALSATRARDAASLARGALDLDDLLGSDQTGPCGIGAARDAGALLGEAMLG
jgi:hypothetical protein